MKTKRTPQPRSADLQSAVSQTCSLPGSPTEKGKPFCKITPCRNGFSIRCDPETLAALWGMAMLKKGLFMCRKTDADLRVINAFTLFRAHCAAESSKHTVAHIKQATQKP